MGKNKERVLNIMGTDYVVHFMGKPGWNRDDADGYVNYISKEIFILLDGSKFRISHVMHHEIVHAMFFECGLEKYAYDETLMDFIARQLPKFDKFMSEGDAMIEHEFGDDLKEDEEESA